MVGSMGQSEDESKPDLEEPQEEDGVSNIEKQLDDIEGRTEDIFGDASSSDDTELDYGQSGSGAEVIIDGGVAVPSVVDIQEGESVTWENQDDTTRRIRSVEGQDFDTGQLEEGESYEEEFESEGVTVYVDTIAGGSELSGAVVVGDAERPDSLPSEIDEQPVPFSNGSMPGSPDTMSDVAEEIEQMEANMGTGFN
jgi:plastocyanin